MEYHAGNQPACHSCTTDPRIKKYRWAVYEFKCCMVLHLRLSVDSEHRNIHSYCAELRAPAYAIFEEMLNMGVYTLYNVENHRELLLRNGPRQSLQFIIVLQSEPIVKEGEHSFDIY
jgi:hypothetical protein